MKTSLLLSTFLLVALTGMAGADVPGKASSTRYRDLWLKSPFTSPPAPVDAKPEADPFQDYALIGVSPVENNGYRVTLASKTKPDERITLDSGATKEGFSILGVDQKAGDPLGTIVTMKNGTRTGMIRFDVKLLATTAPKGPAAQPQQPQPKAATPSTLRPRVVQPNP
ncbi:MAG: hypothetical protein EOP88_12695 [Verrucomicrobiaceae bacterium]|nr:MAG: hypothetical protein EOP88_12695 [Verrucomicrobiaceae bacterium]